MTERMAEDSYFDAIEEFKRIQHEKAVNRKKDNIQKIKELNSNG
jgi:hypothetical protein